jgi:hypothetical protein
MPPEQNERLQLRNYIDGAVRTDEVGSVIRTFPFSFCQELQRTLRANNHAHAYFLLRTREITPDLAHAIIARVQRFLGTEQPEQVLEQVDWRYRAAIPTATATTAREQNDERQRREQEVERRLRARVNVEHATDDIRHRNPRTKTTLQIRSGWEIECTEAQHQGSPDCDDCTYTSDERDCTDCRDEYNSGCPLGNEIERQHDGSVNGDSLEYISRRPHTPLRAMRHLQEFMDMYEPKLDDSCGIHFHISIRPKLEDQMTVETMRKIEKKYKKKLNMFSNNLYMLASIYEEELFKVLPQSRNGNSFCRKLRTSLNRRGDVKKKMGNLSSHKYNNNQRYCWLNFVELYRPDGIRTVEFRALGDTENIVEIVAFYTLFLIMFWGALQIDILTEPATLKEIMDNITKQFRRITQIKAGKASNVQKDMARIQKMQAQIENMRI